MVASSELPETHLLLSLSGCILTLIHRTMHSAYPGYLIQHAGLITMKGNEQRGLEPVRIGGNSEDVSIVDLASDRVARHHLLAHLQLLRVV